MTLIQAIIGLAVLIGLALLSANAAKGVDRPTRFDDADSDASRDARLARNGRGLRVLEAVWTVVSGRVGRLVLGIVAASTLMASTGQAAAQSECTLSAANIPSLQVVAGSAATVVLDTANAATLAYMNSNCGSSGNTSVGFETVEGARDILSGQVVTLTSGSTISMAGSPRRITYQPGSSEARSPPEPAPICLGCGVDLS